MCIFSFSVHVHLFVRLPASRGLCTYPFENCVGPDSRTYSYDIWARATLGKVGPESGDGDGDGVGVGVFTCGAGAGAGAGAGSFPLTRRYTLRRYDLSHRGGRPYPPSSDCRANCIIRVIPRIRRFEFKGAYLYTQYRGRYTYGTHHMQVQVVHGRNHRIKAKKEKERRQFRSPLLLRQASSSSLVLFSFSRR